MEEQSEWIIMPQLMRILDMRHRGQVTALRGTKRIKEKKYSHFQNSPVFFYKADVLKEKEHKKLLTGYKNLQRLSDHFGVSRAKISSEINKNPSAVASIDAEDAKPYSRTTVYKVSDVEKLFESNHDPVINRANNGEYALLQEFENIDYYGYVIEKKEYRNHYKILLSNGEKLTLRQAQKIGMKPTNRPVSNEIKKVSQWLMSVNLSTRELKKADRRFLFLLIKYISIRAFTLRVEGDLLNIKFKNCTGIIPLVKDYNKDEIIEFTHLFNNICSNGHLETTTEGDVVSYVFSNKQNVLRNIIISNELVDKLAEVKRVKGTAPVEVINQFLNEYLEAYINDNMK